MAQSLPRRGDFCRRKGTSPFGIDPPTRRERNVSLGVLDSELIRKAIASNRPSNAPTRRNKNSNLGKLPGELREMVFMYALSDEWTGKTPAIIKAVRTEGDIYFECMAEWYKHHHTYIFHEKNNWSFLNMKPEIIATVTKVKIIIDENIALHPLLRWIDMKVVKDRTAMSLNDLSLTAALASSVTSVTLDCRPTSTNLYYWYPQKFAVFFSGFKHLKYAAVTCPIQHEAAPEAGDVGIAAQYEDGMINSQWQETTMTNGIEEANSMLGSVAKLDRVYADKFDVSGKRANRKFEDREKWVWVAEEGKFLEQVHLPRGLQMGRY